MNKNENEHDDSHAENCFEDNFEDNFVEDLFDTEIESYVQECEITIALGSYQYLYFLIREMHIFRQNDKWHCITPISCRNCMNTFTTVDVLTKHKRVCQKKERKIRDVP